jgi:senataxin
MNDTRDVGDAITKLSKRLTDPEQDLAVPSIRKQMWKEMYDKLGGSDVDGLAVIIAVQGSAAHTDSLAQKPFRDLAKKVGGNTVENTVTAIDNALTAFRSGFLDAVSKFANYTTSSVVLDLLKTPGTIHDIMALMLSPNEDNQMAAQALVGQAFDVDDRQDCFKALLENLPHASFNGIFDVLEQFIRYAALVPEACSLSKSIVRCMTDVIEVLCSSENGLLRNSLYLKKGAEGHSTAEDLPRWWKLMARSISIIFRRTPGWSLFFGTKEMVEWMRDALIFCRDMLAQWKVIEGAALVASPEAATLKPGRMSRLGRRMVEDLKEVLVELGRWLRLTDEELLYQSFALLETLLGCFKETSIPPPEEAIRKFTKTIDDSRKKDLTRPQTRLDTSRILRLEDALAVFKDDDDEVEVVSGPVPVKGEVDSDVEILDGPPPQKTVTQKLMEASKSAGKAKADKQKLNLSVGFTTASAAIKDQSISRFFSKESKEWSKEKIKGKEREREKEKEKEKKDLFPTRPTVSVPKPSTLPPKPRIPPPQPPSDESSDESAEETGFAALGGIQRKPSPKKKPIVTERKPVERRGIQIIDFPGGNAALRSRLDRRDESRRTQLRLKPDISGFHRVLLSWNYDHEGQEPPFVGHKHQYAHIVDRFSGFDQYGKIFQPLLMMECWAQIVKSKDDPQNSYPCTVSGRHYVDDWIDVDLSIADQPKEWTLAETDVVLLREQGGKKSVLCKAQVYRASQFGGCTATVRCVSRCDPGLANGTTWSIVKVFR